MRTPNIIYLDTYRWLGTFVTLNTSQTITGQKRFDNKVSIGTDPSVAYPNAGLTINGTNPDAVIDRHLYLNSLFMDGVISGKTGIDTIIDTAISRITIFRNNGTEQARLNTTGLGIGTTNPLGKLHIARDDGGSHANAPYMYIENTGTSAINHRAFLVLRTRDSSGVVQDATIRAESGVLSFYLPNGNKTLAVVGSHTNTTLANGDPNLRIANTDQTANNWQAITFGDSDTSSGCGGIYSQNTDHTNNYGSMIFATRGVNGYRDRFSISPEGSVVFNETGQADADFRVEGDTKDKLLFVDASADVVQLGDPTGGSYTQFESDGTMAAIGNATTWKDINVGGVTLTQAVANRPTLTTITGTNILTYAFNGVSLLNELHGAFEIQHDYKVGSDIVPHVHFYPTTTGAGNVKWNMEYWIKDDNIAPITGTISSTTAVNGIAWEEIRTNLATVVGTNIKIGSQFHFRLWRDPNDVADTYGADAAIGTVGIHYECDTLGSRQITTK